MVFRNREGNICGIANGFAESGQPGQPVELALELDRPEWYTAYLSMESAVFFDAYFRKTRFQIRRFFTQTGSI